MTMQCAVQSIKMESILERAGRVLANWWAEYTILHNRSLIEEVLRQKQAGSGKFAAGRAPQ